MPPGVWRCLGSYGSVKRVQSYYCRRDRIYPTVSEHQSAQDAYCISSRFGYQTATLNVTSWHCCNAAPGMVYTPSGVVSLQQQLTPQTPYALRYLVSRYSTVCHIIRSCQYTYCVTLPCALFCSKTKPCETVRCVRIRKYSRPAMESNIDAHSLLHSPPFSMKRVDSPWYRIQANACLVLLPVLPMCHRHYINKTWRDPPKPLHRLHTGRRKTPCEAHGISFAV